MYPCFVSAARNRGVTISRRSPDAEEPPPPMSSMSRSSSDPAERSSSPAPSSPSSSASVSYARPSPTDVGLPPRATSSFAGPSSREGAAAGGRDDTRDDRSGRRERTLGFPLDDASSPVAPSSLGLRRSATRSAQSWNCSSMRPEASSPSARLSTRSPPRRARSASNNSFRIYNS